MAFAILVYFNKFWVCDDSKYVRLLAMLVVEHYVLSVTSQLSVWFNT